MSNPQQTQSNVNADAAGGEDQVADRRKKLTRLRDELGGDGGELELQVAMNGLGPDGELLREDRDLVIREAVRRRSPILELMRSTPEGIELAGHHLTRSVAQHQLRFFTQLQRKELVHDPALGWAGNGAHLDRGRTWYYGGSLGGNGGKQTSRGATSQGAARCRARSRNPGLVRIPLPHVWSRQARRAEVLGKVVAVGTVGRPPEVDLCRVVLG